MVLSSIITCPYCQGMVKQEKEQEKGLNITCPHCREKIHYKKVSLYETEKADPFAMIHLCITIQNAKIKEGQVELKELEKKQCMEKEKQCIEINRHIGLRNRYMQILKAVETKSLEEAVIYIQNIIDTKPEKTTTLGELSDLHNMKTKIEEAIEWNK